MKSNYLLWLVAAGILLLGIWYWSNRSTMTPVTAPTVEEGAMMAGEPVVVALAEQNDLGQTGTATLEENSAGMLVVTLAMAGGTFAQPQPAHIHLGACPNPGAVELPLTNVVDGESVTTLDVSWADLEAMGEPLAINVHKSGAEASVYTACGDLPVKAGGAMMEDEAMKDETMVKDEGVKY